MLGEVPSSLVGLLLLVVVVLPGAVCTWACEREGAGSTVGFGDRVLRFVAASAVLAVVLAWPEYLVYRVAIAGRDDLAVGQFAVLWLGLVVVVALPGAAGTVVGGLYATRSDRSRSWPRLRRWLSPAHEDRVLRLLLGRSPDPRAWDFFFAERPKAFLRLRLADGTWLAGRFAGDSYASGFPHDPDLYLEEAWEVDGETGRLGEKGLGYPLYVAAGTVEWIEVLESSTAAEEA